uniref:Dendritic cell-specific transmembrane protein-like domain-containing protein n=1 Tax=Hippocampus comes TaxID=109280 RepID=A0A3Q3DX64_HIPCM
HMPACIIHCVRVQLSSVIQVLSVLLLALVLLTVDVSVFRVLDVVSKHTHTTFNVTSKTSVDIKVGGTSMMARLLRRTFSAFNTSSRVRIVSDNQRCVTTPSSLAASAYISVACCLLLAALFSCLQVYANRLRRVIAAFYHPRREKTRILFLYNLSLHRRMLYRPTCNQQARTNVRKGTQNSARRNRLLTKGCSIVCVCVCVCPQVMEYLSRLCRRRREASRSEVQSV